MTARNDQPIGLIDISAVEYEARAARAAVMRDVALALPPMIARFLARFRLKPQAQPQTKAFA